MTQSRLESFVESLMNVVIGYVVAIASQLAVFPLFGIDVALSTNLWIGAWFTLISVVRSYTVRRLFNARMRSSSVAIAKLIEGRQ